MKVSDLANSAGRVFFFIADNPGCTIKQIAQGLTVTERTIWEIIGALKKEEGLIVSYKDGGRLHHYKIHQRFCEATFADWVKEMNTS